MSSFYFSANTSVSLISSNNVFYEKIGGIKKLETSMFIPNNGQMQEFEFERKNSGLRIKIKVSNLYLIPHYIDLDHDDDNDYIMGNTFQRDSNKEQYQENKKNFCR
jgi:hypothetical protein